MDLLKDKLAFHFLLIDWFHEEYPDLFQVNNCISYSSIESDYHIEYSLVCFWSLYKVRNFELIGLLLSEHVLSCYITSFLILVSDQVMNSITYEVIIVMTTYREISIEWIIDQEEIIIGLSSWDLYFLDYAKLLHFLYYSQFDASHEFLYVLHKDISKLLWEYKVFTIF